MGKSPSSRRLKRGTVDWASQQLTEFLSALSSYTDRAAAIQAAVERAAEAFEAEIGVLIGSGKVIASVGPARGETPEALLLVAAAAVPTTTVTLPVVGACEIAVVPLDGTAEWLLLMGRPAGDSFTLAEVNLLQAMGRVLSQSLLMLNSLARERSMRGDGEHLLVERNELLTSLTERQMLLERLSRIQRSISHRAPLQEVLDAITSGVRELIGDEISGLRLTDPADPSFYDLVSICGVSDELRASLARGPTTQGAGGQAITENRLVIIYDYASADNGLPALRADRLAAAMAAPVHEDGLPIGSLAVATYEVGRTYSAEEQAALLAFAEHASLALADARTVEAMREAQRTKDLFLAMVSHELKTPLTVIMGTLRTLQKHGPVLSADTQEVMLEAAFGRGRELERMIDRLLRGARAELAGARRVATVSELVSAAVSGFDQVRRVVVTEIEDLEIEVDTAAVQDAIGILLENAVSHSSSDTDVVVSAEALNHELRVTITNVGELPADVDRAALFAPFQRGSAATSAGVGLGLYIAVRLAEAMDGRIDLDAADGHVAFTLIVPAPTVVEVRRRSATQ